MTVVDPARRRRRNFTTRYNGLTSDEYEERTRRQGGKCAACGQPETRKSTNGSGKTAGLSVDHDHATGIVRGLLCSACNIAIGHMKDSPERLRAAADYLEKHLEQNEVKVYFVDPATLR